jgi:hypothetical protein
MSKVAGACAESFLAMDRLPQFPVYCLIWALGRFVD